MTIVIRYAHFKLYYLQNVISVVYICIPDPYIADEGVSGVIFNLLP